MSTKKPPHYHIEESWVITRCRHFEIFCPHKGTWRRQDTLSDAQRAVCNRAHLAESTEQIVALYVAGGPGVHAALASNDYTPEKLLHVLTSSDDEWVLRAVASNPRTPSSSLERVATNPTASIYVLENLAHNPNTSVGLLKRLAGHENEYVRESVARNMSTPYEILLTLASDTGLVREAVSRRAANLPFEERTWIDIEVALADDDDELDQLIDRLLS